MKHKLISCLLITTMVMTSVPVAFAMENNLDKESNKDASVNTVASVMPTIVPDGGGESNDIVLYGNERYKYRTETRFGSWGSAKSFTITKSQAVSEALYEAAIIRALGQLGNLGGPIVGWASKFGASVVAAFWVGNSADKLAGKYTVKRRSVRKVQVNILTGSTATLENGYQFQVTHNGSTVTQTFWY